ncbi:MAG: dihydropyrimidine dehydrogenase, partial [Pelagerythrobacter marensis]
EEGGVEFVLGADVGQTISFDAIRGKHDAVLIATGVYQTRDLDIDNAPERGVVRALDYLTASNRVDLGDEVPDFEDGELNAAGKRVVVIGGGDTAMDCVRTAIRQGATSVKCLYRRDRANMPGSQREVQNAEEEGVEFVWLSAPNAFAGHAPGVARKADEGAVANAGGDLSGDGVGDNPTLASAHVPVETPNEPADLVIKALGFEPEDIPRLWGVEGLEVTRWGTIKADFRTHRTSLPGVWAVGDIVRGASLVVWAIRDGREAADAIAAELAGASRMAAE